MPAARGLNTKARMPYLLGLSPAKRLVKFTRKCYMDTGIGLDDLEFLQWDWLISHGPRTLNLDSLFEHVIQTYQSYHMRHRLI